MSFNRVMLKLFLLVSLLAVVVSLTACSFVTTFVVTNESSDRIQIRYVVKKPNDPAYPPSLPTAPAIMLISELEDKDVRWRELSPSLFTFNVETRTVVLILAPKEALRVEQRTDMGCEVTDPQRVERFSIEEINITGSSGAIRLTGEQARKSFVSGPGGKCVLTYR